MKEEWFGTKTVDGKLGCEKCGSNEVQITSFADGANFYSQSGVCAKCGNQIAVRGTYEPGDEEYQGEDAQ